MGTTVHELAELHILTNPMQARGLWGPRDIHKKVWELPVPEFKQENKTHSHLAQLAEQSAERVKDLIPGLTEAGSIGRARSAVRQSPKKRTRRNRLVGETDSEIEIPSMVADPDAATYQHESASLDRLCPSLLNLHRLFFPGLPVLELSLDAPFHSTLHRAFRVEL